MDSSTNSDIQMKPNLELDLMKLGWVVRPYEPKLEPGVYTNVW
jgi:hypothetical protein